MGLAVVVGGSSGIGYAIATMLSSKYTVVNMSRHQPDRFEHIRTDVTDKQSVQNAFIELLNNYGVPDIMVYCAGFVQPQRLEELSKDAWEMTMDTNLKGAFYCTQQFAKLTHDGEQKIVFISSTAGTRPQPGWSAYAASKAGLINFSLSMSEELKELGIKVYCVAPGRCATPLRKKLAPEEDQSKIMQPEEVAAFVKDIIDDGSLIDGQVIFLRR